MITKHEVKDVSFGCHVSYKEGFLHIQNCPVIQNTYLTGNK